jgi:hypothetical protein
MSQPSAQGSRRPFCGTACDAARSLAPDFCRAKIVRRIRYAGPRIDFVGTLPIRRPFTSILRTTNSGRSRTKNNKGIFGPARLINLGDHVLQLAGWQRRITASKIASGGRI